MSAPEARPFISVIIPVRNAQRFLPKCLESLNNLNYPRDRYEVIIADSSSTDRTREIASGMGAKVVNVPGQSVCAGRNSGFKEAKGQIIAFSDADCVMDKDWLNNAIKYFRDDTVCCVGGPSLIPDDETAFGKACGLIFSYALFTGGSSYGRQFQQARQVLGNPGCNAIYRRSALEKVMPVDECLSEAEDVFMNRQLGKLGFKFLYTPDTRLWHYRSSTPKRFWRQNFRYAVGRVLVARRDPGLCNFFHYLAGFSVPLVALLFLSSLFIPGLFLKLILLCLALAAGLFFWGWFKSGRADIAINMPFAALILLTAWSLGFIKQFFFASKQEERG